MQRSLKSQCGCLVKLVKHQSVHYKDKIHCFKRKKSFLMQFEMCLNNACSIGYKRLKIPDRVILLD